MTLQAALDSIKAHDPLVVADAKRLPPSLVAAVDDALPDLDEGARMLAVRCLVAQDAPGVGAVLLRITDDSDPMIAAAAAEGLFKVHDPPPVSTILDAAPRRGDDFLRGRLYLLAGRLGAPGDLERLRQASSLERSRDAMRDAQVAAVRLGGGEERRDFLVRVQKANPEDVLDLCENLTYLGDPSLTRALLAWLPRAEPVMRLGNDASERMARMCDMAVWTAKTLGVAIPDLSPTLVAFTPEVLARAEAALEALPT